MPRLRKQVRRERVSVILREMPTDMLRMLSEGIAEDIRHPHPPIRVKTRIYKSNPATLRDAKARVDTEIARREWGHLGTIQ